MFAASLCSKYISNEAHRSGKQIYVYKPLYIPQTTVTHPQNHSHTHQTTVTHNPKTTVTHPRTENCNLAGGSFYVDNPINVSYTGNNFIKLLYRLNIKLRRNSRLTLLTNSNIHPGNSYIGLIKYF